MEGLLCFKLCADAAVNVSAVTSQAMSHMLVRYSHVWLHWLLRTHCISLIEISHAGGALASISEIRHESELFSQKACDVIIDVLNELWGRGHLVPHLACSSTVGRSSTNGGWCRLCERQTDSGGLNGRPEKLQDVCYSWWCLSALSILGRLSWIDQQALADFILNCQVYCTAPLGWRLSVQHYLQH